MSYQLQYLFKIMNVSNNHKINQFIQIFSMKAQTSNIMLFKKDAKSTNNTLIYFKGKRRPVFYLPVYTRLKIVGISNVNYMEMSAILNVEIKITIGYRGIDLNIKNQLLNQGIRLCFPKDKSIILKRDNPNVFIRDDQNKRQVEFNLRRFLNTQIDCYNIQWTPFETIQCQVTLFLRNIKLEVNDIEKNLRKALKIRNKNMNINQELKNMQDISIEALDTMEYDTIDKISEILKQNSLRSATGRNQALLRSIKFLQNYQKLGIQFYFNMMDHSNISQKIQIAAYLKFGLFQVSPNSLGATYSSKKFTQKDVVKNEKYIKSNKITIKELAPEERRLKQYKRLNFGEQIPLDFNFAHFNVTLFKAPQVAIATIFLPMLLISMLNLGIFFQDRDLKGRILSIGSIMVSFVALVPVIRKQIPPTQKITGVQFLVFIQSLTTILALFDSLAEKQSHKNIFNSQFFIASLIITALIYIVIISLTLKFFCYDIKGYKKKSTIKYKKEDFNSAHWRNIQCDREYEKDLNRYTVKILEDRSAEIQRNKHELQIQYIRQDQNDSIEVLKMQSNLLIP